ncbi:MAG: hypothetical protein WDO73_10905 [Ignavibacteriota bacterium]
MAGDVNKVQPQNRAYAFSGGPVGGVLGAMGGAPQVTEKTFDDYPPLFPSATHHASRPGDQAGGISTRLRHPVEALYIYDGMVIDRNYGGYQDLRQMQQYGTQSNPHVWVMREFVNNKANHLGVPLPQGACDSIATDQGGQIEFTGENQIEHTPENETVRVYTGNAFDITGERRQTKFQSQMQPGGWLDESFEIKLRNHKKEATTVRVVEHLYRWATWVVTQESAAHRQTDSKTIEYEVTLQPDEEKTLTYTAHYTW